VYHGPEGLARIARRVHRLTALLKQGLEKHGFTVAQRHFFDTITVDTQGKLAGIVERGHAARMNFRDASAGRLGISLDETTTREDVEAILAVFGAGATVNVADLDPNRSDAFRPRPGKRLPHASGVQPLPLRDRNAALPAQPRGQGRGARPLDDPAGVVHDETERHLRDDPVSWREFAHIHPLAPSSSGAVTAS
jgi:glycine dehydrogenase